MMLARGPAPDWPVKRRGRREEPAAGSRLPKKRDLTFIYDTAYRYAEGRMTMAKQQQSVTLKIRRGIRTSYLVVLAKNIMNPEPGSWISATEASSLIREGVNVTIRQENERGR